MFKEYKARQKKRQEERKKIRKGYLITDTPVTPKTLEYAVAFRTIKDQNNFTRIGFTLAEEGEELADPKCLEFIRKRFLKLASSSEMRCKDLIEKFKEPLPKNLIAISISRLNFHAGKDCQSFVLEPRLTNEKGVYTYQKMSESLQYTYYNENGTEFQAGFCYYPTPIGKPKLLTANKLIIRYVDLGAISYPLKDRRDSYKFFRGDRDEYCYGRFCKTARERVVVVVCYRGPSHLWLNLNSKHDYAEECRECAKDHYTYKYVDPKKASKPQIRPAPEPLASLDSEPLTVLQILESAGIHSDSLEKLKTLPEDTKIPMINRTTGKPLPESKWPEVKHLLISILLNSTWTIDPEFKIEAYSDSGTTVSDSEKFSMWLWDNPHYVIHCKTEFVAKLMMGNLALNKPKDGEKCNEETSAPRNNSSESLLDGAEIVNGKEEVNIDSELDAELVDHRTMIL